MFHEDNVLCGHKLFMILSGFIQSSQSNIFMIYDTWSSNQTTLWSQWQLLSCSAWHHLMFWQSLGFLKTQEQNWREDTRTLMYFNIFTFCNDRPSLRHLTDDPFRKLRDFEMMEARGINCKLIPNGFILGHFICQCQKAITKILMHMYKMIIAFCCTTDKLLSKLIN